MNSLDLQTLRNALTATTLETRAELGFVYRDSGDDFGGQFRRSRYRAVRHDATITPLPPLPPGSPPITVRKCKSQPGLISFFVISATDFNAAGTDGLATPPR